MDYSDKHPEPPPDEIVIQLVRQNAVIGPEDTKVLQAIIHMALTYNAADQTFRGN